MKTNRISLISALVIFSCGVAFGVITSSSPTVAQPLAEAPPRDAKEVATPIVAVAPAAGPIGRFQIVTWNTSSNHGFYLLDTATGEVWHAYTNGRLTSIKR